MIEDSVPSRVSPDDGLRKLVSMSLAEPDTKLVSRTYEPLSYFVMCDGGEANERDTDGSYNKKQELNRKPDEAERAGE